jgi:fumarate reductase subunit D
MLNLLYSTAVLAADEINLAPTGEFSKLGNLTAGGIVSALIRFILVIAALVFFFILVFGGIQWITSGGDKANTETARNRITAALVGLVIVFSAWAILQLIKIFFGIDVITTFQIPSAQ